MKINRSQLILAISLFVLTQSVSAVVIDLFSGNGAVGGADSEITHLLGPANGPFLAAFTPADFAAAQAGPSAQIVAGHPAWITPATFAGDGGNASAQWISNILTGATNGNTALYAIDFIVPFAVVGTAELDFYWSVDNGLGNVTNAGVFLNGMAVAGPSGGNFSGTFSSLDLDVASLLVAGANTLYVNSIDVGGPGGIIFSASLDVAGGSIPPRGIPEPTTIALLGLGLGMIGFRKRKV